MTLESLSIRLEELLRTIVALSNSYGLPEIIDRCMVCSSELKLPLKIALTGITSAGKSTLLNAFVKRNIAPTGAATLTYNVNVFRHISLSPTTEELIIAHLIDGQTLRLPIDSLVDLVDGRLKNGKDLRDRISWIEAFIDSDILKDIDLIDTPGLGSTKEKDSKNTFDLFNDELRRPDVIVYMVQKEITNDDVKAAKDFQKSLNEETNAKITGLNTVLALTHCDYRRQEDVFDDIDYSVDFHKKGEQLIETNRKKSADFRSCFSKSFTIAALYAQSGYALTPSDFSVLKRLQSQFGTRIVYGEFSKKQIVEDDELFDSILKGKDNRLRFIERIDMEVVKYGVWWICEYPEATFEDFKNQLIDLSGVEQMESYIFTTFTRLAIFFKAIKIHSGIMRDVNTLSNKYQSTPRKEGLRQIAVLSRDFEVNLRRSFSFLSVLMDYYQGKEYFQPDEWEIALKTIDFCLSCDRNIEILQSMKSYWKDRIAYYRLISDNEATESCLLILEQIKICV